MQATNATQKTTSDDATRAEQEQAAQEQFHDAMYLGTDGAGADHWWSIYHQAIVVFEPDGTTLSFDFPESKELPKWIDRVGDERGWETLRYTDGPGAQLAEAVEA
jgi:hypothetical protein